MEHKKMTLNIQLFSENGEYGADSSKNEGSGEKRAAGENTGDESFEGLINGKYKKDFSEKVQSIIDKRFKKTKELEAFYDRALPVINGLNEKYGLESGDFSGLENALKNEADGESGGSKSENPQNAEDENNEAITADGEVRRLVLEGESLKELYPDFDIRTELNESELFFKLVKNGISVKDAFETVHKDELISGAMEYTAHALKEQLARGREQRASRPLENGLISSCAAKTALDVNALGKNDIINILKQVEKGEKVRF